MKKVVLAILTTLVVGALFVMRKVLTTRIELPPPYSGIAIYTTLPNSNELLVLQGGPSVEREIDLGTEIKSIAVGSPGFVFAVGATGVQGIDANSGVVTSLPASLGSINAVVCHPDGQTLFALGETSGQSPGFVKVFDLASQTVVATISLPIVPTIGALSLDGKLLYVSSPLVSTISVIDWGAASVKKSIPDPGAPRQIVASPTGLAVYVLHAAAVYNGEGTVGIIDPTSNTLTTKLLPGAMNPTSLAVNPAGDRIFVTSAKSHEVVSYNATTFARVFGTKTGANPVSVAISKDASLSYVLNGYGLNLLSIINPTDGEILDAIPLGRQYRSFLLDSDGQRAYALSLDNKVLVTHRNWLTSGRELARIPTGTFPAFLAVHLPTHRAYVANVYGKSITVVDVVSRSVVETIPLDRYPAQIILNAAGTRLYGAGFGTGTIGSRSVWALDLSTKVLTGIPLEGVPGGLALNEQESLLFVTLPDERKLVAISTATYATQRYQLDIGQYPVDVIVAPSPKGTELTNRRGGEVVYVANESRGLAPSGSISVFNAVLPLQLRETVWTLQPRQLLPSGNARSVYILYFEGVGEMHSTGLTPGPLDAIRMALSPDGTRIYLTSNSALLSQRTPPVQAPFNDKPSPLASGITGSFGIVVR